MSESREGVQVDQLAQSKREVVRMPPSKPEVRSIPPPKTNMVGEPEVETPFLVAPPSEVGPKTESVEVVAETETELSQPNPAEKQKINEPRRSTPISNFINWFRYPPAADTRFVRDKVTAPASVGIIVSALAIGFASSSSTFLDFAAAHHGLANGFILGSLALLVSSGITMLGSFAFRERMKKVEMKNRISFSQLLTVSKVFTTGQSLLHPAFAKLDPEFRSGFTGELHFAGKNRASWEGLTTPLATLRDGARGLYNLATACEQQDPQLKDITMFGGISSVLSPQFEKYGFYIFPVGGLKKQSIMSKSADLWAKLWEPDSPQYPNRAKVTSTEAHIGVISREELIQHKSDFARLAKIDLSADTAVSS